VPFGILFFRRGWRR